MSLFAELKRRNVARVGIAYALIAWVLLQAADFGLDLVGAPNWIIQALFVLALVGLPASLVFAWVFEMTPEGLKRESEIDRSQSMTPATGRRLDRVIIGFLAITVAFMVASRYWPVDPDLAARAPGDEPAAATDVTEQSIAVLPFTTRSMNEEDVFFSDGMHDDLLTQLAKIGSLKVISRTSVMEYRDTTKKLGQIGEELGVTNIVEGGVQRSGNQVRINMQLIDARTDAHLWADNWTRELTADNLFAIQSEITLAIAAALQTTLTQEEQQALSEAPTHVLAALEAYRTARNISSIFDERATLTAKQEARRAVELDPEFAEAWAQLGYIQMAEFWTTRNTDRISEARQSLDRALALDPQSPETAVAEAYYWYWGFLDYERSLSFSESALERYPNHPDLLQVAGYVNRRQGNVEQTLEFLKRAAELSPLDRGLHYAIGETELGRWNFDEAALWNEKVLALDPTFFRALEDRARLHAATTDDAVGAAELFREAYLQQPYALAHGYTVFLSEAGQFEAALAIARTDHDIRPFGPEAQHQLEGVVLLFMGRKDEAHPLLEAAIPAYRAVAEADGVNSVVGMGFLCQTYGALANQAMAREYCELTRANIPKDQWSERFNLELVMSGLALANLQTEALDVLEHMMTLPFRPIPNRLRRNPALANLHDHPRFEAILTDAEERFGQ